MITLEQLAVDGLLTIITSLPVGSLLVIPGRADGFGLVVKRHSRYTVIFQREYFREYRHGVDQSY